LYSQFVAFDRPTRLNSSVTNEECQGDRIDEDRGKLWGDCSEQCVRFGLRKWII
jgi:hypothetical protein